MAASTAAGTGGAPLEIQWPTSPGPTCLQERAFIQHFLIRGPKDKGRGKDLPEERKNEIADEAAKLGLTIAQAMSLRRQALKAWLGKAVYDGTVNLGSTTGELDYSKAVELLLQKQLKEFGAVFRTEGEMRLEVGNITASFPDIVFMPDTPVYINGQRVHWIDCKTFYGTSSLVGEPHLHAMEKLPHQIAKFTQKHGGPGAIFFLRGFSRELREILQVKGQTKLQPSLQVLFLDATPVDAAEMAAIDELAMSN